MTTQILIVDLENPEETHYRDSKTVGYWFLGRRLSDYMIFAVNDRKVTRVFFKSPDIKDIQQAVDSALEIG